MKKMNTNEPVYIGIEHLHPHPQNPRKDLGDLTELADSIMKRGVMQNLTVIPQEGNDGEYTVLIGYRRLAASKLAGVTELRCVIVEGMDEKEQVGAMLEENMQRNDLTVYEQAQGFQLMLDLGESVETIEKKTGFSRTTIQHRLNIAKLDQEALQEKAADKDFQLTIKDLCELEKVQNIKTRNKILKEAQSSAQIVAMALQEARNEKRKKNEKELKKRLAEAGIKKAPEGAYGWSMGWERVKEIKLDEELPKKMPDNKKNDLFWVQGYNDVEIIKEEKKEKHLSEAEKKRQEEEKKKKQLKKIYKAYKKDVTDFCKDIIDGRTESPDDEAAAMAGLWEAVIDVGVCINRNNLRGYVMEKEVWKASDAEKEAADKVIKEMPIHHQLLAILPENLIDDPIFYDGTYNYEKGAKAKAVTAALSHYGYVYGDEEQEKVIDGTHELYKPTLRG